MSSARPQVRARKGASCPPPQARMVRRPCPAGRNRTEAAIYVRATTRAQQLESEEKATRSACLVIDSFVQKPGKPA